MSLGVELNLGAVHLTQILNETLPQFNGKVNNVLNIHPSTVPYRALVTTPGLISNLR